MAASPTLLYLALTQGFDIWLAIPESVRMRPQVGEPFYFEADDQGTPVPHYGRFLRLEPDRLVEFAWVTGAGGTEGVETVVRVDFVHQPRGIRIKLRHSGFPNQEVCDRHRGAWPAILERLDERTAAAS